MKYQRIRECGRSDPEQRYIWARLAVFSRLPAERQEEIRALIGELTDSPEEGRALFSVLVRGKVPQIVSQRTGVSTGRLYELRRLFYERAALR